MSEPATPWSLTTRAADLSLSKPPRFAWQDRIVLGAFNLICGVEGAGKGTLACWIFAQLTRGQLPGDLYGKPANVAIIGDEDSWQDVWVPRLHAANADLDRVKLIERGDGSLIELAASQVGLARIIGEERIALMYLDALVDNLGTQTDDWRTKQVREALAPARQIARQLGPAVLGSLHPNKSGGSFRQLVSGSVAFNALSRSSLLLAEHPEDPDRRVLVRAKGNLSARPDAIEFSIDGHTFTTDAHTFNVPRAVEFSTSNLTTDDLLARPATPPAAGEARTDARELIAGWLMDGDWHPAGPIIADCQRQGIYGRAAQRAADDLGIEKKKDGFPATVSWRLKRQEATPNPTVAPVASVASRDMALESRGDREDIDDSAHERRLSVTSANGNRHLTPENAEAIAAEHQALALPPHRRRSTRGPGL
jgi:AAA domain